MIVESKKPVAAAQADYSKVRRPVQKEDLELSAAARELLDSIEEPARPKALAAAFPRIVNRMAGLWKTPRLMDRYFEDLLTDDRGNRKGFPLAILTELTVLKDYYQSKVFPVQRDVFGEPTGRSG
jgi:hypothetical protein